MVKLILFTADFCKPCKALKKDLQSALKDINYSVETFDLVQDEELFDIFNITRIPTTFVLRDSEELTEVHLRFVGLKTKEILQEVRKIQ